MLSYRKSQQVSLTEKLKMKNVIHVFGASGSGTTMARLCLSAFARVATQAALQLKHCIFFATAHSCGLRRTSLKDGHEIHFLCHSAFARVATMAKSSQYLSPTLCHSAFARVATYSLTGKKELQRPLPQRIRAGCDCGKAMQRTANLLREGR